MFDQGCAKLGKETLFFLPDALSLVTTGVFFLADGAVMTTELAVLSMKGSFWGSESVVAEGLVNVWRGGAFSVMMS